MIDDGMRRTFYSYKILINKAALREKYDIHSLKNYIVFQLHGYMYNAHDRINYTINLSLKEMVLTITKKDGSIFSTNEWVFFDRILPGFFEKLEV